MRSSTAAHCLRIFLVHSSGFPLHSCTVCSSLPALINPSAVYSTDLQHSDCTVIVRELMLTGAVKGIQAPSELEMQIYSQLFVDKSRAKR